MSRSPRSCRDAVARAALSSRPCAQRCSGRAQPEAAAAAGWQAATLHSSEKMSVHKRRAREHARVRRVIDPAHAQMRRTEAGDRIHHLEDQPSAIGALEVLTDARVAARSIDAAPKNKIEPHHIPATPDRPNIRRSCLSFEGILDKSTANSAAFAANGPQGAPGPREHSGPVPVPDMGAGQPDEALGQGPARILVRSRPCPQIAQMMNANGPCNRGIRPYMRPKRRPL